MRQSPRYERAIVPIGLALAFVVGGCARPPLYSGWQIDPHGEMHLVLINQGSAPLTIKRIIVNASTEESESGWSYSGPFEMEPGRVVLIPLDKRTDKDKPGPSCQIPVSLLVTGQEQGVGGWNNFVREILGRGRLETEGLPAAPSGIADEFLGCGPPVERGHAGADSFQRAQP